jgi:hypothetical protein
MEIYEIGSGDSITLGKLDSPIRDLLNIGEHTVYGTVYEDNFGDRVVKYTVIHRPGLHLGTSCSKEKISVPDIQIWLTLLFNFVKASKLKI